MSNKKHSRSLADLASELVEVQAMLRGLLACIQAEDHEPIDAESWDVITLCQMAERKVERVGEALVDMS